MKDNKALPPSELWMALCAGFAIARDACAIAAEYSRYQQDVVRTTSEASQALLRARSVKDMVEAQTNFLFGTAQSFRDRTAKIAEIARRTAVHPQAALKARASKLTRV